MPDLHLLDPPGLTDLPRRVASSRPERAGAWTPILGGSARLYWMLFGNAFLYVAAVAIAQQDDGGPGLPDALFWAGVVSLIVIRYLDIARWHGATASGEPASLDGGHRYARGLCVVSAIAWIVAHGVAWAFRQ